MTDASTNPSPRANPAAEVLTACRQAYEASPNSHTETALAAAIELHQTLRSTATGAA